MADSRIQIDTKKIERDFIGQIKQNYYNAEKDYSSNKDFIKQKISSFKKTEKEKDVRTSKDKVLYLHFSREVDDDTNDNSYGNTVYLTFYPVGEILNRETGEVIKVSPLSLTKTINIDDLFSAISVYNLKKIYFTTLDILKNETTGSDAIHVIKGYIVKPNQFFKPQPDSYKFSSPEIKDYELEKSKFSSFYNHDLRRHIFLFKRSRSKKIFEKIIGDSNNPVNVLVLCKLEGSKLVPFTSKFDVDVKTSKNTIEKKEETVMVAFSDTAAIKNFILDIGCTNSDQARKLFTEYKPVAFEIKTLFKSMKEIDIKTAYLNPGDKVMVHDKKLSLIIPRSYLRKNKLPGSVKKD